ncbi:Spore germination protein YndE [Paenibacillus solanacearum]|uniref:Spore germination protein YndE n=1 Tax=Paenibacillus solanacearum TaxID=2048548 RepID=A0A916JVR4_9BACL|nr:endospore germination permease [Paenibacillus solanacearum]CAG7608413.1 Spore germination protein YndE [Paenibacillus solanacearum]
MDNMTLSNRQLFWMMVSMQVIMTILLTTSPAIQSAQQDAWFSSILATGIGSGIAYISVKLGTFFPGQSLISYSRLLLGKWMGRLVSSLYLIFWITTLTVILKQFSLFITGTIMPKTPVPIIIILMLLVVLYPTLHGVAVIARICELTGPIILIGVLGPMFLAVNEMKADRLLPVFSDNGYWSIVKGSLPIATFLGDCIMTLVLVSFVIHHKHAVRHAVAGVMVSGILVLLSILVSILIFGPYVAAGYPYPMLMIVRSISLGGIIENLDAIVITIWITSIFTKLALYLFVAVYGTAQLFGLKDWRKPIWIIAPLCMILALIPFNFEEISVIFPALIAVRYMFPLWMVGGPLLLFLVALIRRRNVSAT